MTRYLLLFAALTTMLTACIPGGQEESLIQNASLVTNETPRSAIVQLFNWPFRDITREVCALRDAGFSHIHVSPPQMSNNATAWWGRYQPLDYRRIDGPLGSMAEFEQMTQTAQRCGITVIADVVLNHMANLNLNADALYFPPGCDRQAPLNSGGNSCLFTPSHFHQEECIYNYGNHCAVLYGRICGARPDRGLPDLATGYCEPGGYLDIHSRNYNPHVFAMAKQYLLFLQDVGVRAFRFDAAKHMHPAFLYDLLTDTQVTQRMDYIYGEIITDRANAYDLQVYRHIPGLDFMDFPLSRSLIDAFSLGGYLGLLENIAGTDRALDGATSVSFVTNHDVWGNAGGLGYRFGRYQDELLAHIYVLGRGDGLPYIYSEYDDGPSRQARGVTENYVRFHQRNVLKSMMIFHTRMLGQAPLSRWQDAVHLAILRGNRGFMAINKSGDSWNLRGVDSGLPDGTYVDTLSSTSFEVQGGRVQGEVPPQWGLMLVPLAMCPRNDCRL